MGVLQLEWFGNYTMTSINGGPTQQGSGTGFVKCTMLRSPLYQPRALLSEGEKLDPAHARCDSRSMSDLIATGNREDVPQSNEYQGVSQNWTPQFSSSIQNRAHSFRSARATETSSAFTKLMSLVRQALSSNADHGPTILILHLLNGPAALWGCLCECIIAAIRSSTAGLVQEFITLIRVWIKCCRLPPSILREIKELSDNLLSTINVSEGQSLSNDLETIVMFGLMEDRAMWTCPISERGFEKTPGCVADILGYMEAEVRTKYLEAEITGLYAWRCKLHTDNVRDRRVFPFQTMVSIWTKSCILFQGNELRGTHERTGMIKYFIDIAKECQKLKNFATTHSILMSLQELDLQSLKITRRNIDKKDLRAIGRLRFEIPEQSQGQSSRNMVWPEPESMVTLPSDLDPNLVNEINAYNSNPDKRMSIEDCKNLLARLCPRNTLEEHRLRTNIMKDELRMGAMSIWSSIQRASEQSQLQRLHGFAQTMNRLQDMEVAEQERTRAAILF
ncbi:unnamed protein product [Rhizoctonia solani]|uniref:Ras-GEF domain-containing protein n=1 Tax=Rhizoctonia solani TaxID=456999 RepID=A0A8H3BCK1_9AGAM|nr:unnamed protein product [Rhizoctonia solani]